MRRNYHRGSAYREERPIQLVQVVDLSAGWVELGDGTEAGRRRGGRGLGASPDEATRRGVAPVVSVRSVKVAWR